mmetsp:Transcript_30089/g.93076  ORF Transcript_30089/g.93076 Transcript_30089/m.93076 type:complete len:1269 (-) Transcript_30089:147-3953(-)
MAPFLTQNTLRIISLSAMISTASGHGYMNEPESRQFVAFKNNGGENPGPDEYNPHGIAAVNMYSACPDCSSRGYPGVNPWSAPGTAPSVGQAKSAGVLGVCGVSIGAGAQNYNAPSPDGVWGEAVTHVYEQGQEIDVSWCVSADHGGVPQFRLCADEALVSALTTQGYEPTLPELDALEACFQAGSLRCDDVASNACAMVSHCDGHEDDWEACSPGQYLHCSNELGTGGKTHSCINTNEQCAHGTLAKYKLKIPDDFPTSGHTILNYRWDTLENNEAFVGCADVAIVAPGGAPPDDAPAPTPKPVAAVATPRPSDSDESTSRPTSSDAPGHCCFDSDATCGACGDAAPPGNWCAQSEFACVTECEHVWCEGPPPDGPPPDAPPPSADDGPAGDCAIGDADPVDNTGFATAHGKLRLDGLQLVDAAGAPVQLMGMSSHGLHWFPDCYKKSAIRHLAKTWGINVFRAAMYVGEGGYAADASVFEKVQDVVRWTKELGIYVVIDWHVLNPGDPNDATYADAPAFWERVANDYKDETHVIYEIANEPNGVAWADVKAYNDRIIGLIRNVDPHTIIVAGTTTWSQDIHLAAADPVAQPYNVMYAFHFYACTHDFLLDRVKEVRSQIPIFVSEWGTSSADGNGGVCTGVAERFLDVFSDKDGTGGVTLSFAQWSWADKAESSAALSEGACADGAWDDLSCSGEFLKSYIQSNVGGSPDDCVCRALAPEDTAFAPVTDEWCLGVACDPAYAAVCTVCDGSDPAAPPPPPPPTAEPTAEPTEDDPRPTTPAACEDSTSWRLNDNQARDCQWVRKNTGVRCPKGDATTACPAACGACDEIEEPTAKPTEAAADPMPTSVESGGAGTCCFWSVSNDSCDCLPSNLAPPNDYCAVSENRCAGCGGNWCAGDPEPSPKPTEAVPSPRPSARPTNEGESAFPTVEGDAVIAGYVENWEDFSDFSQYGAYTTLLYSFLTLDAAPDHLSPREISWTGSAIYETMTRVDVLEVMADTGFSNPYNWMRQRIVGLMNYAAQNGKKFIWAFGGWSDLTKTISDDQVGPLVDMLVTLLERHGGDGIDFDWEHLSKYKDADPALHAQQRRIVGKVIVALKDALVAAGMGDKLITYTPRYNGFLANGAYGSIPLQTDGEAVDVVDYVAANSPYGVDAIDFVHFMMYDIDARSGFAGATSPCFVQSQYDAVVASASQHIPADKIVMGFEPGPQAYTGQWCGMDHDEATIAALHDQTGGIMFWAVNDRKVSPLNGQSVGQNSNALAAFAAGL